MKKMGKLVSLTLAMLLLVGMVPMGASAEPLFPETFEINVLATTWSPYDPAMTEIWDEIERLTNVKLNFEWQPQADFDTKVGTVLASGEDAMPDLIGGANIPMLLNQGAIVPLDDALAAEGQNILAVMNDNDMPFWRQVVDGKIYTLPTVIELPGAMSTMIRKDWLDRVGKTAPTTWDEFLDVLRAFRDQDANGDGDASNEIPFALDTAYSNVTGKKGLATLMNAFGIKCSADGQFCVLDDGTYTMVYEHPRYKEFLAAVQSMYAEGLIDPEFTTRTQAELFKIMDNGTLGCTMTWAERSRISTDTNREIDPKAEWVCVAPIKGPSGDQMIEARNKITNGYTVTIAAEKRGKVEGIVKFINWIYSEEGSRLMNFGIEGKHYEMVDGQPTLKAPYNESFVAARQSGLIPQPFIFKWDNSVYMQCLTAGKSYEELNDSSKIFYDGLFTVNKDYYYVQPPTLSTEAYIEYQAELISAVAVLRDKACSGLITIDEFFTEYETIKGRGLADIIEQGNEAYKLVMGK